MPKSRTVPCLPCKEKHLKCDGQRPVCQRCQTKNLECRHHSQATVFVHSNEDDFSEDQEWVTSRADRFCFDFCTPSVPSDSDTILSNLPSSVPPPASILISDTETGDSTHSTHSTHSSPDVSAGSLGSNLLPSVVLGQQSHPLLAAVKNSSTGGCRPFPLEDLQEACLLKHFIDHVAPWFDIADPDRHFQLVVPIIARSQPHLLNAIFAVSARHMTGDPRPSSRSSLSSGGSGGVTFEGRPLPTLTHLSAVEYMLECLPALRRFHEGPDDGYLASVVVTAAMLRQLEHIDKESTRLGSSPGRQSVLSGAQDAFLPLINGMFRSPLFTPLFHRSGLVQAACLMVLRQEIYYSMGARRASQMVAAGCIATTSFIHEVTVHMLQVTQWCWGKRGKVEWNRLIQQQEHIEQSSLLGIQPLFQQPADASRGEIVPTIWYSSRTEVYCIQLAMMARSILTLEGSNLRAEPEALPRPEAEKEGRILISELYGIAAGFAASPHAILHAAMMTRLYGYLFTDEEERRAFQSLAGSRLRAPDVWPFGNPSVF